MTWSQRSGAGFAKYAVDINLFQLGCQSKSIRGLGTETPMGRGIAGGCGGVKPIAEFFFSKFLLSPARKIQNWSYLKTKSRSKKKSYVQKNERQVNYNLSCKFGHFWRKLNFWAPKTPKHDMNDAIANLHFFYYWQIWTVKPLYKLLKAFLAN